MFKISIAMATYNGGKYLPAQLESIIKQSRLTDELVVCDDGSTDDTSEVLEKFRAEAPFPVRIHQNDRRLGYAGNFERAIGLCSGDLVFPCDQDDVWLPTKLSKHEAIYAEDENVGMVVNDGRLVDSELKPLGRTWFEAVGFSSREFEELETDRAFRVLARESRICGCMMSIRSRLWCRVVPIPEKIGHDEWTAMVLSLLCRLRIIREPLNDYRQHATQVTKTLAPVNESPPRAAKMEMRVLELANLLQAFNRHGNPCETPRFPGFRQELKGQMGHFIRRSSMVDHLSGRLPLVLIEFLLGNYARYTNNVRNNLSYDIRPKFFR